MDNFLENFSLVGEGSGVQFSTRGPAISTTHPLLIIKLIKRNPLSAFMTFCCLKQTVSKKKSLLLESSWDTDLQNNFFIVSIN